MALKIIQRVRSLGKVGAHLSPLAEPWRLSRCPSFTAKPLCVACLWTSSVHLSRREGCQRLETDRGRVALSTLARDPFMSVGDGGLHGNSSPHFTLTELPGPMEVGERAFLDRLTSSCSSAEVLKVLRGTEVLSGAMAAAALHRVADLEEDEGSLRDPAVLESETLRAMCLQLERDSDRLTDSGLASALLACTRLYVDPWSTLVVRLVSEGQARLDGGRMSVEDLSTLGRALLALGDSGCGMLAEVMEQVQRRKSREWSPVELKSVYLLLQAGAAADGRYQNLLDAMNARAASLCPLMDGAAVSSVLAALVALGQKAPALVTGLCGQVSRHVPVLSDGELEKVLSALVHFGHSDRALTEALERRVPGMAFTSPPETLSVLMQYFGRRNILSPVAFDAVAESFVYRADEYSASQVARQVMPFGKLGYLPPNAAELFRKMEALLHARFAQFKARTLLNLLHSCVLVERFPVNFFSRIFSTYFLQQLHEQGTGMDPIILTQLTQINLTIQLECPYYKGPRLPSKYCLKSLVTPGRSVETLVDEPLYRLVSTSLEELLGSGEYYAPRVLTPYCYTLDVEIKLDEQGYVLPAQQSDDVNGRVALCIDGRKRFSSGARMLMGKEATKQRHLRLLGYDVVQIPFYEFEELQSKTERVEYLHKKIFPHSYRHSW